MRHTTILARIISGIITGGDTTEDMVLNLQAMVQDVPTELQADPADYARSIHAFAVASRIFAVARQIS